MIPSNKNLNLKWLKISKELIWFENKRFLGEKAWKKLPPEGHKQPMKHLNQACQTSKKL